MQTAHVLRSPSAASSPPRQLIPQPLLENYWTLLAVFLGSQVALAMTSLAPAPMERTVVLHTVIHVSEITWFMIRIDILLSATKLSFVFSQYYQANNRNSVSCNFAGNATVNSAAPSNVSAANAAATSCLASGSATFTPTAPAGSTGTASAASSSGGKKNGAVALVGDNNALWGMGAMVLTGLASCIWTLV